MNTAGRTPPESSLLDQEFRMLIGGELTGSESGERLTSYDPATLKDLASFPNGGPADVDRAVEAAGNAFPAWRALDLADRQAVLRAVAGRIRELAEELALLDTLDTGNVIGSMRADVAGALWGIEHSVALASEIKGEVTHLDRNLHYTRREPYGVVAKLLAFNHPLASAAVGMAPPLLAGNCVVVKPSPHTSLSALAVAAAIEDVAPPGVINFVTGANDRVAVPLIRHPGIRRLSLTCSAEAARSALALASENMKTVTLEGGGKNPLVVFPDVDLDFAVDTAIAGMSFQIQSQSCASTSRVLVHRSIHKAFVEKLVAKAEAVRVGPPTDPASQMGAVTHKAQYEKILDYIAQGQAAGARLLTGGSRPAGPELADGLFLRPAVFDGVEPSMSIAQDEIFGPVVSVMAWDDFDEMVAVANGTIYGLTAVVLTNDLNTAVKAANAIEAGYVEVNGAVSFAPGSPFGGVKQSGLGREFTLDELLGYTQVKSININLT